MRAWQAGNVAIANAPGAGVADDKVVYAWVPDLIRYYLGEEPLIAERADVPLPVRRRAARSCSTTSRELVVKPANESGGYGIAHRQPGDRRASSTARPRPIEADPRNWVAQPILDLSTAPTLCDGRRRAPPRRPAPVHPHRRARSYVTAGGLTRVALRKGSLVVNSSQGGGSKDTWIVDLGAGWGTY